MRRRSQEYDEEAARREPLLQGGGSGGSQGHSPLSSPGRGGASSSGEEAQPAHRPALTHSGTIRLTKRSSTAAQDDEEQHGLVLKDAEEHEGDVRELEVEVVAGAVAEAVAEAVQEAVHEAVHDAVQQAIEENVQFDVRGNVYTLIAVTGVILFWRGVWQLWDNLFGTDSLWSNLSSLIVGLAIMLTIRVLDVPLAQGLPGG